MKNKVSLDGLIGKQKELITSDLLREEFKLRAKQPTGWAKQKYRVFALIKSELASAERCLSAKEMADLVVKVKTIAFKKDKRPYIMET